MQLDKRIINRNNMVKVGVVLGNLKGFFLPNVKSQCSLQQPLITLPLHNLGEVLAVQHQDISMHDTTLHYQAVFNKKGHTISRLNYRIYKEEEKMYFNK